MKTEPEPASPAPTSPIRAVAAGWTFAALVGGFGTALVLARIAPDALARVLLVAGPIGDLWLRALQATIVPLVAALLFTGIVQTAAAARAGALARRTLVHFVVILAAGTLFSALVVPVILRLAPIPAAAANALKASAGGAAAPVPGMTDYLHSLIPANVIEAAATDAMLPMIVFVAALAAATTQLPARQREALGGVFEALGSAMLVMIGWILAVAPLGVFALSLAVVARSGTSAVGALVHYVLVVSSIGLVVLLSAPVVALVLARVAPGRYLRAVMPALGVALSTQSSLASLPAMLDSCRRLGVRQTTADLVLPLAVALFRATSPAMNLAVSIYVARWYGLALTPGVLAAGFAVAMLVTVSTVSLPGAISFVSTIGPIALAMGVPVAPLALLVAVEVLPDLVRTVGNVAMDVAVAAAVDRRRD